MYFLGVTLYGFYSAVDRLKNPMTDQALWFGLHPGSSYKNSAAISSIDRNGRVNFLSPGVYPTSQVPDFSETDPGEHFYRPGRSSPGSTK